MGPKHIGVMTLTLQGHGRYRPHDQSICYTPFPIGVPLEPSIYLQPFLRYSAPKSVHFHTVVVEKAADILRDYFFCRINKRLYRCPSLSTGKKVLNGSLSDVAS